MRRLEGAAYSLPLLLVTVLLPGFSSFSYQRFMNQHRDDPKSSFHGPYCDTLMERRGLTRPQCKEISTFIHSSKMLIKAVCNRGGVPDGQLRRSRQPFRVTSCTLKNGSIHPPCEYKENTSPRYIVIGCEDGWPVYYDESQIVTMV